MAADREVTDYDGMSSDKLDGTGQVEQIERFTANDIRGSANNRHVQKTKPYRKYIEREEGEFLSDPDKQGNNQPQRGR
jgi:lysophospholipid acyltransferase (LPLAT)-like uncharacterized protein